MIKNEIKAQSEFQIKDMIYTIRNKQVMIDRDLAKLYNVGTKVLNQAVKRNIKRFPMSFRFQLTKEELDELVTNCDMFEMGMLKHSKTTPYAFTEQGISMLSAVLKSDIAIEVSIKIMNTFVEMRNFLLKNQALFSKVEKLELRQLKHEDATNKKFEQVFNTIAKTEEISQKVFFSGQIYDAFSLLVDIIQKAKKSIVLIDNYVDTGTLNILCKRKDGVKISIYTSGNGSLSVKDIKNFNLQYKNLSVKKNQKVP